jgi:hypothetical protein
MKREFQTARNRREDWEGNERAEQLALALASRSNAETLEALLNLKCAVDQFGGEFRMAAVRPKLDARGRRLEDVAEDGQFETVGYVFEYKHIAKIGKQPTEPDSKGEFTADDFEIEDPDALEEWTEDDTELDTAESVQADAVPDVELDEDGIPVGS